MLSYPKSIFLSITGNIIEWYDFGLFVYLVPLYTKLFFPPAYQSSGILMIFAVFASGFMVRPIGAAIFGYRGDKYGRSKTISLTLTMISISGLITACMPTYASIGLMATSIFILQRFMQGICIGGEFAGSIVYLVEIAPENKRAFFSSFCNVGSNLGILLAVACCALLANIMPEESFNRFGWRIPFIIGAVVGLAMVGRVKRMQESKVFEVSRERYQSLSPLKDVWKNQKRFMLQSAGIMVLTAGGNYTLTSYLNTYLNTSWGYSLAATMTFQTIFLLVSLVAIPLCGFLTDYVGSRRVLMMAALGYFSISLPCFMMIPQLGLFAFAPLMLFYFLEQGSAPATLVTSSPVLSRYSQVSLGYNLTMSIVGGFTPFINACLVGYFKQPAMPAMFLMACALVTGMTLLIGMKHSMPQVELSRA